MKTFSQYFKLKKKQAELDFVDVFINADIPLFLDPFAISLRRNRFMEECHQTLEAFFDKLIQHLKVSEDDEALSLLSQLKEPNETSFGLSQNEPSGAGIGPI